MGWDCPPARLEAFIRDHVRVQDSEGGARDVPLVPTRGQVESLKLRAFSLGEKAWCFSIKGRQAGFTTWNLACTIAWLCECPGIAGIFAAPDDVLEGPIRAKWEIIWRSVADSMGPSWPGVDADNDVTFRLRNGSRVMWVPCGKTKRKAANVSIGDTVHFAILSEMAKWPHADVSLTAMLPALERARASVIVDSTAPDQTGIGEAYLEMARRIIAGELPDRELFFWPWWWVPEYRSAIPAQNITEEEQDLVALSGGEVDARHLQWRRAQLADPHVGKKFQLIYPSTPDEALNAVTESAFDDGVLARLRRMRPEDFPPPLSPGDVHRLLPAWLRSDFPQRDMFCQPSWGERPPRGYVRVWEPPRKDGRYWIGVDSSEGKKHGDWQVAVCLDEGGRHVATVRTRVSVLKFASLVARMAWLYNEATIEVEMASTGPGVVFFLLETVPEAEILLRGAHGSIANPYPRSKVTQRTPTHVARVERKDAFVDHFNAGAEVLDPDLRAEMLGLDPETREKPKGQRGVSDDYLDAVGIAVCARKRATFRRAAPVVKAPPRAGMRPKRGHIST